MYPKLTIAAFAALVQEPEARVREWISTGLIGADVDGMTHLDLARVRVVQACLQQSIPLDAIVRSARDGELAAAFETYLDQLFPGAGRPAYTLAEAAELAGLEPDVAARVWEATVSGRQNDVLSEDDLNFLRMTRQVLAAGFPVDAMVQLCRVWGDALGRAAETVGRLFHFYVHEQGKTDLSHGGRAGRETIDRDLRPLIEPAILYFLRRGMVWTHPGDLVLHVAAEAGLRGPTDVPGQVFAAIVFIDLASFTPLAEAMGDVTAAGVLDRFSRLVRNETGRYGGQIVKQIGDAFMLVFPDAASAVEVALAVGDAARDERQFPALRAGVHLGSVLFREGDYVGTTVNIASRVAAEAGRHEVLVTAAVRQAADAVPRAEFLPAERRALKGIVEEQEVFLVRRPGGDAGQRAVDPVCGMELAPEDVAARLTVGERLVVFCSDACLRRFVASPGHYD